MTERRPIVFWLAVLACVVYAFCYAFTISFAFRHAGLRRQVGWTAAFNGQRWVIASVDPQGPAAGLVRPGDALLARDGDRRIAVLGPFRAGAPGPDRRYELELERDGARQLVGLSVRVVAGDQNILPFLILSLAFFACGAALVLLRPSDPLVRLYGATLMVAGLGTLADSLRDVRPFLEGREQLVLLVLYLSHVWPFPMAYHFSNRFPQGRSAGPAWTAVQWGLYAFAALALWPSMVVGYLLLTLDTDAIPAFFARYPALFQATRVVSRVSLQPFVALAMSLALVATINNYRRLQDPGGRRRLRWFAAGFVLGTVPWIALLTAAIAGAVRGETFGLLYPIAALAFLAIPACTAIAVWKDQLFDIRVVVRRGMQYLLARNGLRALLVVPIVALVASIAADTDRTIGQMLTGGWGALNVLCIAAIAVSLQFRERVQTSLDRRFFREAYREEQVLLQLIDEVRDEKTAPGIARLVTARIESVLHPASVHVFHRSGPERMVATHSSPGLLGERPAPSRVEGLSDQRGLLRIMDGIRSPQDFPFPFDAALPVSERQWLEGLGVRLIVPILGRSDQLAGLLLLGEKLSDQPYSSNDRRLLQRIGAQMGIAYDGLSSGAQAHSEEAGVTRQVKATVDGVIDGKYRLERELGRGGMGVVHEATDLRLERRVAVKILGGALAGDPDALRRFEREARAAARLEHPHITRIYDYGALGAGAAYMVMELVAGNTWRVELERAGAIDPARAAEWFRQLLDGVHVAHQAGVVHRDLKPENVIVTRTPAGGDSLKILDFGLAKIHGAGPADTLTQVGTAVGTVGYMSPEEISGGDVDARADLFAVGVMVVEALTGQRPFRGRTMQEAIVALLGETYHLPGTGADVVALDAVVQKCLAKNAAERYGSAAEVSAALIPALAACGAFGRVAAI